MALTGRHLLEQVDSSVAVDEGLPPADSNAPSILEVVQHVEIFENGYMHKTKVLYLTNDQCNMFKDEESILRCLADLEMGKFNCIIRLLSADRGVAQYVVHTQNRGNVLCEQQYGSELDAHDATITQQKLDDFMRECILPIATSTRALIICSGCNDDAMAAALGREVVPELIKLGNKCSSNILTVVRTFEVQFNAAKRIGTAGKIAWRCPAWKNSLNKISKSMENMRSDEIERCDLMCYPDHLVVFEAFEKENILVEPSDKFLEKIIGALTCKLPSIAIQMYECQCDQVADLSRMGVPILFLDNRERAITFPVPPHSIHTAKTHLSEITNALNVTVLSNPTQRNDPVHFDDRRSRLQRAFDNILSVVAKLTEKELIDYDNSSAIALVHAALTFGVNSSETEETLVPLYSRIQELQNRCGSRQPAISKELVSEATAFLTVKLRLSITRAKLSQVKKWQTLPGTLHYRKRFALEKLQEFRNYIDFAEENDGAYFSPDTDSENYKNIRDILSSPMTFSGSVFDVDGATSTVSKILQMDRLPRETSLEALDCLRRAWDCVDSYHHNANFYKLVTKVAYALLLLAGIATSIIAISRVSNGGLTYEYSQYTVVCLTGFVGIVAGFVNFTKPTQRWQELRGAAVNIESEIWKYRTRVGDYRKSRDGDAETLLNDRVQTIMISIQKGSYPLIVSPNFHKQRPPHHKLCGLTINRDSNFCDETVSLQDHAPKILPHRSTQSAAARSYTATKLSIQNDPEFKNYETNSFHYLHRWRQDKSTKLYKRAIKVAARVRKAKDILESTLAQYATDNPCASRPAQAQAPPAAEQAPAPAPAAEPAEQAQAQASAPAQQGQAAEQAQASAPPAAEQAQASAPAAEQAQASEPAAEQAQAPAPAAEQAQAPPAAEQAQAPAPAAEQALAPGAEQAAFTVVLVASRDLSNAEIEYGKFRSTNSEIAVAATLLVDAEMDLVEAKKTLNRLNTTSLVAKIEELRAAGTSLLPEKSNMRNAADHDVGIAERTVEHLNNLAYRYAFELTTTADRATALISSDQLLSTMLSWTDNSVANSACGFQNNHYSPTLPSHYIAFRMNSAVKFYEQRINACRRSELGRLVCTVGSFANLVLAFLDKAVYIVIIGICITAVIAWLEFRDTANKIQRYNSVIISLKAHLGLWRAKSLIEKCASEHIDHLILITEQMLLDELNTWISSTATQTHLLQRAIDDASTKNKLIRNEDRTVRGGFSGAIINPGEGVAV